MKALLVAGLAVLGLRAGAQESLTPAALAPLSVTAAGVPFLGDLGPRLSFIRDRRVGMAVWRQEWPLAAARGAISFTMELPVSVVLLPRTPGTYSCISNTGQAHGCSTVDQPSRPVLAVGVNPVGLRIRPSAATPLRPFVALSMGVVAFDRPTPVAGARAINFAASFDIGAELARDDGTTLMAAWRFQHWSNAGTARRNPGIDANVLYVGIGRRRQRENPAR